MTSELVNDRVIGLPVHATLVSMIQLLNYSSVCLIFTFNDHSPMTGIRSVTDISHAEYSLPWVNILPKNPYLALRFF